jgi:ribonucleoside-diphosphate reductase alpha chain
MKSLYYCRSKSISRAAFAGKLAGEEAAATVPMPAAARTDYEECLACQ